MHRFFVNNKNDSFFSIDNNDFHHIKNVIKLKVGEKIECVFDQQVYLCEIHEINTSTITAKIIKEQKQEKSNKKIIACIGLIREQKFDLLIQKLVEIGVTHIIPVSFNRSIVKIDKKNEDKKIQRWREIITSAAKQSKQTQIPIIENSIKKINDLKFSNDNSFNFFAYEQANQNYNINMYEEKIKNNDSIIFVVGPEGGIDDKEVEELKNNKFTPISLGSNILRAETAGIYITSIINYLKN